MQQSTRHVTHRLLSRAINVLSQLWQPSVQAPTLPHQLLTTPNPTTKLPWHPPSTRLAICASVLSSRSSSLASHPICSVNLAYKKEGSMTAAFVLVVCRPTGKPSVVGDMQGEGPSEASGTRTAQGARRRQAQGYVQEGHPAEWASRDWQNQFCHDHQQVCPDDSQWMGLCIPQQ